MGKVHEHIDQRLSEWIMHQPMFFVGSAPSGDGGHINLSPKGPIGTFRVLDGHTVAYLDVVGSGAETIAHVRQNGRIVIMFCAFSGPPLILRLHGTRHDRAARRRGLRAAGRKLRSPRFPRRRG